jgi:hypothetical protein
MTYGHTNAALAYDDSEISSAAFTAEPARTQPRTIATAATYPAPEQSRPSWLDAVHAELQELLIYPKGWDSYGAAPVSRTIAASAYNLLQQTAAARMPKPSVVPTSKGAVQIEWHTRGIDLEVCVLDPARLSVSFEDARYPEHSWEKELTFDVTPLKDAMLNLLSRSK